MPAPLSNLLAAVPTQLIEEQIDLLAAGHGVRIERIVSTGQASPPGFWYDSEQAEWVALLSGEARLLFEERADPVTLRAGDHLLIAPHERHRVEWTTPDEPTIWLAVYFDAADA